MKFFIKISFRIPKLMFSTDRSDQKKSQITSKLHLIVGSPIFIGIAL